ncbi:LysR family transcriptional regulator [Kitasatospora sp. NBC_01246]|uniref:LysR family transcriptional regulator n=1 Tax=Kitasatospora sp. NBC_01246 TaxID=2903570 RepID=UPI002E2ED8F6|nr:LysR family transcriptional regulator [Kitasatospora sp. NBC_01246]
MHDHQGVELRHLRYFVTVAEEGTMTEAARVLRIAQPSLSQQISALERRVGAKLFHRRPKGMELTEGGRILYTSATLTLAEIESSLAQARDARSPVRVGVCGTVPDHLLARVEQVLAEDGSPDVEFTETDSPKQLDLLRTGTLALGVMRAFHDIDDLATLTLADEPLGVLLRPDHPLAHHTALSWADLAGQDLLWFPAERNPHFTEDVLAHLAGHGWSPRLRTVDAHSRALYRHHLRNNQNLITLRTRTAVTKDTGITWRPFASDPPRERFLLATPDDSPWADLLARSDSRPPDDGTGGAGRHATNSPIATPSTSAGPVRSPATNTARPGLSRAGGRHDR